MRQGIIAQSPVFTAANLLPVPCNPDALAMAYTLKLDGEVFPLTRYIDPVGLLQSGGNTIVYERDPRLRQHLLKLFSTTNTVDTAVPEINQLGVLAAAVLLGALAPSTAALSYSSVFIACRCWSTSSWVSRTWAGSPRLVF